MRILQIITQGEHGGAQKNVLEASLYLSKRYEKVFVATGRQKGGDSNWLFQRLREEKKFKEQLFTIKSLKREVSIFHDLKTFFETYKLVKILKPHIVHVHSSKAGIICGIAAKIAGSRVVYTVHGFVFLEPLRLLKKVFYILLELIGSFFRDLTITVSKFDELIGRRFFIIRNSKGVVIYNGVNPETEKDIFSQKEARKLLAQKLKKMKSLDKNNDLKIIGTVANLYKTKGIEYLIDAAQILKSDFSMGKNILFVVFGEGEEHSKLIQKIKGAGLEKNFLLPGALSDAYKYLRAFDVIVLPSVKEGFPYIFLESILAKVPFVGTKVGGLIEVEKYVNGKLVPLKDSLELAEAILSELKRKSNYEYFLPDFLSSGFSLNRLESEYYKLMNVKKRTIKTFLVTMPAYNEGEIIRHNVLKVHDYLQKNYRKLLEKNRVKLCIAINGSTDNTENEVRKLQREISYLTYTITKEKGRGGSLDNSWKGASEDVFLYIDSDLAYDLNDLGSMLDSYIANENFDMVVASRRLAGSIVKRKSFVRKILTEGYNRLIRFLFLNSFTDAQAGCKSITREAYLKHREKIEKHRGWFFDTALLLYAEKSGMKIKDIVITCVDNREWRLKIVTTVLYFMKELAILRLKTLIWGFQKS